MQADDTPSKPVRHWAVVPAAGLGARLGAEQPKQYLLLNGKPILQHTLERLASHPAIDGLVVILRANDPYWAALDFRCAKPLMIAPGGAERGDSVLNGLRSLCAGAAPDDWVLVHDAARPCLRHVDIDRLIAAAHGHPTGALLGLPVSDTVKRVDGQGDIKETVSREGLWRALTPQMFRLAELAAALESGLAKGIAVTDEASAMEHAGRRPRMVAGHADNIKVTHRQDLALAALYLQQQEKDR